MKNFASFRSRLSCLCLLQILSFGHCINAPVVGILTAGPSSQDCPMGMSTFDVDGEVPLDLGSGANGCLTSFYVKWLESAGARVVPILYTSDNDTLDSLLSQINGVLFTGGWLSLAPSTQYYKTALSIYTKIVEMNDKRDYFPLWGTCMGFQLLCLLTSQDQSVLSHNSFDSEDLFIPLDLTEKALQSRFIGELRPHIVDILRTKNVTVNLHHDGVTPTSFYNNTKLNDFYHVLATNIDRKGKAFVSTIEGKSHPVYGTQWHPERPQFEWEPQLVGSHSVDGIEAMQAVANFFVNEARRSTHTFKSSDELAEKLIYNYPTYYIGNSKQIYQF